MSRAGSPPTANASSGGITAEALAQRLRETLQPTSLEVIDDSHLHAGHAGANGTGTGTHFRVRIRSARFGGRTPLARHRLVYDALQDFLDQGLHALAIDARVPDT